MDIIKNLTHIRNREELISESKKIFKLLFDPKNVVFTDNYSKFKFKKEKLLVEKYSWNDSGDSLLISVEIKKKSFGFVWLEKFKFLEYKNRYIAPALLIADIMAICLVNIENLEKIKQEQERFQLLLEYTENIEYFYHPKKGFFYISPSFERISGYSSQEVYENPELFENIIFQEDKPLFQNYFEEHKKFIEIRIYSKSKKNIWLQYTAVKIFSEEGNFLGIRASAMDITEKKKKEFEVNKLKSMLPICSSCKKIRTDEGYWDQIETYISSISDIEFTHSLCPDCLKKYMKEVEDKKE